MKRIIFGGLLFIGGLSGILLIIAFSIVYPCSINGITGFRGFLISYDIMLFFITFCILVLGGIIVLAIEAYKKK
ncbi:hypothetical protein KQI42_06420 [Tissierella sp. MSJ-40]|uniref:Uncharacterized protein n=1 Tax=Tissierella simiarum TaxID=2841534 RepID=A0ABS6E5Y7_9FIRM|nr:hypothetical protein [Tissierella simiarum]MBU5437633.1 hypothetical protein [Tissierella simiarum]